MSWLVSRGEGQIARALLRGLLLLACALVLLVAQPTSAQAVEPPYLSEAQAAVVCDSEGRVLWSLNSTLQLQPASITKVMTCMLALDSGIDLDKPVEIVEEAPGGNSQTAGYTVGDTTTLRDLLLATLVYSGNDAALNIATIVAGSEQAFVAQMNQRAAELGMTRTHFVNPHGLEEEGHYSCAEDLVKMGRHAIENYPFIARAVRYRAVDLTIGGEAVTLPSTDELMDSYEGLLGIKTGAVESGESFLGAAKRDGITLYTAVLGCPTSDGRFRDTATLLDWAYAHAFQWQLAAREGCILRVVPASLDLGGRRLVTAPAHLGAYAGQGGLPSHGGTSADPGLLADAGELEGVHWWRQGAWLTGGTTLVASDETYEVRALNPYALPLFEGAVSPRQVVR